MIKDPPAPGTWLRTGGSQLHRTLSDSRQKPHKNLETLDESIFSENDPNKLKILMKETMDILDLQDDTVQLHKMKKLLATNPPKLLLQCFIMINPLLQERALCYDPDSELAGLELLGDLYDLNILEFLCLLDLENVLTCILNFIYLNCFYFNYFNCLNFVLMSKRWGQGNSLLHLASFMGMDQTCKLLIEWGVPWNIRNDRGYRPVDCADDDECRWVFWNLNVCDNQAVVKPEIEDIADTTDTSEEEEQVQLEREIVDAGKGARLANNHDVVRHLVDQVIEEGALKSSWDITPSKRSGAGIPPPLALPLKGPKQRKRVQFDDFTIFLQAAQSGELDTIEGLIRDANRDNISTLINYKSAYKRFSPLHVACMNNHINVIEYLLKLGALPNEQDMYGYTPLHYAVLEGHTDLTKFLIRRSEITLKVRSSRGEAIWDCTEDNDMLNMIHRECIRRAEKEAEESKTHQRESRLQQALAIQISKSYGSEDVSDMEPIRKPYKSSEVKQNKILYHTRPKETQVLERPLPKPQGPKPFDNKIKSINLDSLAKASEKGKHPTEKAKILKAKVFVDQGIEVTQVQTHPRPLPTKSNWKADLKLPTRKLSGISGGQPPALGLVAQAKFNLMKRIGVDSANQRQLPSQVPLN